MTAVDPQRGPGESGLTPSQDEVTAWWAANDPRPDCPDEFRGADGGKCETCGWDPYAITPPTGPGLPLAAQPGESVGQGTERPQDG